MAVLTKDEFYHNKLHLIKRIREGELLIHPTDTIYGIGCNAANKEAVKKLREIKQRPEEKPLSVIAPSKEWIRQNCMVDEEVESWLDKLPGPYTLILKLKNQDAVAENVTGGKESIGVRMPDHWFTQITEEIARPIITTSVNIRGQTFMTSLDDVDDSIRNRIPIILYEGEKHGTPSTIVNLSGEEIESVGYRKII